MMERITESKIKFKRRYIQLITAVIYNCHKSGFSSGRIYKGSSKGVCVPGLNCYSCPGAVFACPLGSLQGALEKSAYKIPLYMLGTVMLFGILFGRMICGFLCPFGLIQEIIYKLPFPKIKKSRFTEILSYLKYLILVIFVIAIPVIKLDPGFCKYICPAGTLEAGIPLMIMDEHLRMQIGWLFSWKVFVLIVCILLCSICYRAFCRFLCPLGALYSFFNPISFWGITVDKDKCTNCGECNNFCKVDIKKPGDHECINCGECRELCPKGIIRYK